MMPNYDIAEPRHGCFKLLDTARSASFKWRCWTLARRLEGRASQFPTMAFFDRYRKLRNFRIADQRDGN